MKITSDDVEAARELLKTRWTQGTYQNVKTGEMCAAGALTQAVLGDTPNTYYRGREQNQLENAADDLFVDAGVAHNYGCITAWNDDEHTDKQAVLDGFMTVAKYLRNRGE